MKRFGVALLILVFAMSGCITDSTPQKNWGELQGLPFPENYPTRETTERLYDEMLFHRATQVVIWSLPAMALWAMKKGSESASRLCSVR